MKNVITTIFLSGYPAFILGDGTVMVPRNQPTGTCWMLDWIPSTEYTAKVSEGVSGGGEYGYNITVYKDGKIIKEFGTAA